MTLTTEELTLIRETWTMLARDPDALTEGFYDELFRRAPEYRPLFAGTDLPEQRRKLAAALGLVVKHAHDLRPVVGPLTDLGRRHAEWGVEDAAYDVVGAALLHTIAARLGAAMIPGVIEAWTAAYTAVASTMLAGAATARKKSA